MRMGDDMSPGGVVFPAGRVTHACADRGMVALVALLGVHEGRFAWALLGAQGEATSLRFGTGVSRPFGAFCFGSCGLSPIRDEVGEWPCRNCQKTLS